MRSKEVLGASFLNFFKILSGDVFIRGIFGMKYCIEITSGVIYKTEKLSVLIGMVGVFLLGYAFYKARLELRLFLIFSFLIFFASLITPQVSLVKPQWNIMANGLGEGRYYFFPHLAWIIALVFLAFSQKNKFIKFFSGFLLVCLFFVGIPNDFKIKTFKNYYFQNQVQEFEKLNPGESYTFNINPVGRQFTLIKK